MIGFVTVWTMGCSHWSARESRRAAILSAGALGYVAGYETAPDDWTSPNLHGVFWAGLTAAGVGLLSNEIVLGEETEKYRKEAQELREQLKLVQKSKPELIKQGSGRFRGNVLPEGGEPGQTTRWRLYETDSWRKTSPNQLEHIDLRIEIETEK